ncbi:LiaI-LiaF-like domain-containing protein [Mucilaginibacter antarcticus]
MKNDRIIPGVILVLIGVVILLHNYGYLGFHLLNFVYLIPILIVLWGLT